MKPKAVLFDLDGTLFDHEGAAVEVLQQWLPTVSLEPSQTVLDRWFDAEEVYVGWWRTGQVSWQEQRRLRLRMMVPALERVEEVELDTAFAAYLQAYESACRGDDGVAGALAELCALAFLPGVLTNGATGQQNANLAAIGIADQFEFVLTAEDLGPANRIRSPT